MRVLLLWNSLITGGALLAAMLLAIGSHRLRATDSRAALEYAWAAVPWVMVALCAAPAVHRILAAG